MQKSKITYSIADLAQQMVGGFLLSGPFVVTEEVWALAKNLTIYHSLLSFIIVLSIGYGALYEADEEREAGKEAHMGIIPLRFLSLVLVSYLSVATLIFLFAAPTTFDASFLQVLKVLSIVSIFSVTGAATVDSLL